MQQDSLVLYKNRPARIIVAGDKLEIELSDGKTLKVRPKDVDLLHPGPLRSLRELKPPLDGELTTAWELLAGQTTSLPELAELMYDEFTPATAWATWQHIEDGLYFKGTPQEIIAVTPEEMAQEQAARAAKAAERSVWLDFLGRAAQGQVDPDLDSRYLVEVEQVALGRQDKSRVLRELGQPETPPSAHAQLLAWGYWDHTVDPYPQRFELPVTDPDLPLPALPDEERLDLTHLPAFAIDDEDSADPDDALSFDGQRLWVHVADVAALIPPDSPADLEARARGANLYLPEGTVHMLPQQATGLLALGLAEVSPALSFGLSLAPDGTIADFIIRPSWVRVQRLSYEAAELALDQDPFPALLDLTQRYRTRRLANGAIELDLPEIKIRVKEGQVILRPLLDLRSRAMVREAMLMAGEAAARLAVAEALPFPFTTQEVGEIPPDLPEGLAGMFAMRRSMRPGQIKSLPAPHTGLGLDLYARVTSPLRRYLDLVAHQQVRAYLRGQPLLAGQALLDRVGSAEAVSGSVRQAERLANRHWTLVYLKQNPDWQGEAIVVDQFDRRSTLVIPNLDWEVRMHLRQVVPLNGRVTLKATEINLPLLEAGFRVVHAG